MNDQVADITSRIKSLYGPKKIILFGSYAHGNPSEGSDVDLAVIVDHTSKPYHQRLIELRRLVRTTIPIDFFVFTQREIEKLAPENPFIQEILKTGKIVYAK